jgi:type III secretion protein C
MTLLKTICRSYLIRLWLFSIPVQAALIAQLSPLSESASDDSSNEFYDPEPMYCEVFHPEECEELYQVDSCVGEMDSCIQLYEPEVEYFDDGLRYYDSTTGGFYPDALFSERPLDSDELRYYDHRAAKYYPPVHLDDVPYYEPPTRNIQSTPGPKLHLNGGGERAPRSEERSHMGPPREIQAGSVTDAGDLRLPPEQAEGRVSNESPSSPISNEVLNNNRESSAIAPQKVQHQSSVETPENSLPQGNIQSAPQNSPITKEMGMGQLGSSGSMNLTLSNDYEDRKEANKAEFLSRMRATIPPHNPKDLEIEDDSIAQIELPATRQQRQGQIQSPPEQRPMQVIAPNTPLSPNSPFSGILKDASAKPNPRTIKDITISFEDVPIIEYIRYISKIAGRNFVFNEEDLQFNVTVVSEQMESIETLMSSLLQELQIRDLYLLEQANNLIIHRNPRVRAPARIVSGGTEPTSGAPSELVTRIFRLKTLDPQRASEIIRPLLSADAFVEVLRDTNKLIITDLVANVNKIAQLIDTLDAPNSGVQIGQYVVRKAFVDSLVDLATKILQPIAQGNPFILVPHKTSNSIYIVSNEYIVQKTLAILQNLDVQESKTNVRSLDELSAKNVQGLTSQGTFEKRRVGSVAGGVTPGVVGYAGAPPVGEEEAAAPTTAVQPGAVVYTGQPPFIPGQPGFPPGYEGTPEQGVYYPPGYQPRPGYLPSGMIQSEGRLMTAQGEAGGFYPGLGDQYRYTGTDISGGAGRLSSEGYLRGVPAEAFPYGSIQSGGMVPMLEEGRDFLPGAISSAPQWLKGLPLGQIAPRYFYVYRLKYRRGDEIEVALRHIANDLIISGIAHPELVAAINSGKWDPIDNSLSFIGTSRALKKLEEFIEEIDVALRQVFVEMLILETDIADSLQFGVDWITSFGGGPTNGNQAFQSGTTNPLAQAISSTINLATTPPTVPFFSPANLPIPGYAAAIIGTHLTHNGTRFSTIGALVKAVHLNSKINIVLNPKIVTEDNNTAEVFVGSVDRYKSQSITNSNNSDSLVTNNFQFIDVGTTLRVTPLIGNNGMVTLEIVEERSTPNPAANVPDTNNQNDFALIPVISKDRTVTQVHIPNGCFAILSGLLSSNTLRSTNQIPCLGGIPIIGGFCKSKDNEDNKLNVMIFVRPKIIESDDDLEEMTKRQQDVWCEKQKIHRNWNFEIDETLDQLNIKPTDPDEIGCAGCNQ